MSNLQFAGIILIVVGLVPFTIGALIHMAYEPKSLDRLLFEASRRPWKPRTPAWDIKAYDWSMFTHPKSRLWCLTGYPISLAGFALLVAGTFSLGFLALFIVLIAVVFGVLSFVSAKRR